MLTSIRFFIYGMYIYEYHSLHQHTASTSQFQNQYESFTSLLNSTDNMRHFFETVDHFSGERNVTLKAKFWADFSPVVSLF